MTVSKGAAGKAMAMFISSICSRSTAGTGRPPMRAWGEPTPPPAGWDSPMKTKIWWWEYRNSMDTLRVCGAGSRVTGGRPGRCQPTQPCLSASHFHLLTKMTMMTKAAR